MRSNKAVQLLPTDKVTEMSVVLKSFGGKEWAQRNPEAVVLETKGAPVEEGAKKSGIAEAFKALGVAIGIAKAEAAPEGVAAAVPARKAYFYAQGSAEPVLQNWPVGENVPDNIDGDGDGAEDYSAYALAIVNAAYDINNAMCIAEPARSAAIAAVIDAFRSGAQAMFGTAEKAGARHSKSDKSHIAEMKKAHAKMGEHLAALDPEDNGQGGDGGDDEQNEARKALASFVPGPLGDDGYPANMAEYLALSEKAKSKDKKPYGDVEYADPENGKYPIDTEEHARAAWDYINKQKNADEYSADELKKVKDRIIAACKKFGIEITESKKGAEITGTPDITALVAAEVAKAAQASQASFDAALADARKAADEQIAAAKAEAQKANESAAKLQDTVKALITEARQPSAKGGVATIGSDGEPVSPTGEPVSENVAVKGMTVTQATQALLAAKRS